MPVFDWLRKIDYLVSSQAYANGVFNNFTMFALEVGSGGKLYFSTHSTIAEVFVNSTNLTVSTVSGQGWGLTISYPQGLAYNGSQMYTTDYSGNNADLRSWTAAAVYGSVSTTTVAAGSYGYGGVPLVSTWNSLGNGAVYRASPVTSEYYFSGFSGLNLCAGSAPAGLPASLTFTGGAGGGFFDVTFDGQYWYTLAPANSFTHSSAATYTNNGGQVRVDVYNANGTFREARYIYTIPAGSNQQPGGIAYDPIRKCLWVSIINSGSSSPINRLIMIPMRKTVGRRGWGVTMIGETGRGVY